MAPTAPKQRSETAEQILDLAETLIQTRGYSAFSYQDISAALGIRKASIHYHFASKADLGVAVVDRYIERFGAALVGIAADDKQSSMAMLDFYVQPYLQFASTPDRVCLSGALAGEMMALPPEIETLAEARRLARLANDWQKSDELRRELNARGWEVRDTKDGQKITRRVGIKP